MSVHAIGEESGVVDFSVILYVELGSELVTGTDVPAPGLIVDADNRCDAPACLVTVEVFVGKHLLGLVHLVGTGLCLLRRGIVFGLRRGISHLRGTHLIVKSHLLVGPSLGLEIVMEVDVVTVDISGDIGDITEILIIYVIEACATVDGQMVVDLIGDTKLETEVILLAFDITAYAVRRCCRGEALAIE